MRQSGPVIPDEVAPPPGDLLLQAVEGMERPLFVLDADWRFRYINPAGARARAAPSFISKSLRLCFIAASSARRFHSHLSWRLRMARSEVEGGGPSSEGGSAAVWSAVERICVIESKTISSREL